MARVLIASAMWFPDEAGGSARVATDVARELGLRGHRVLALAPSSNCLEQTPSCTVDVRRVIRRGRVPLTLRDPVETYRAARFLHQSFDVALAHQSTTSVGLAAANRAVPVVRVFHASAARELAFDRKGRPRSLRQEALERLLRRLEASSLSRAQRILVLSEYSRSLIAQDHPECLAKVECVHAGVDTEVFAPAVDRTAIRDALGIHGAGPLVLTVRRLVPRMGIDRLLHAIDRLRGIPGLQLVIVGSGPLEVQLRSEVAELGLEDSVIFAGHQSDDRLQEWYRAADVFVLPTVAYEGFGMVTLEALASGTPVVGTPVGATPELLAPLDNSLVAASSDPGDLAAAIERVVTANDEDLRHRCRTYATRRFRWSSAIESWEKALTEAAGQSEVRMLSPSALSH